MAAKTPKPTTPDAPPPVDVPVEPINPAIDPNRTAQERLDALREQHVEMQRRSRELAPH